MDTLLAAQQGETIGDMVRQWAEIAPEKPVLLADDGRAMTYRDLCSLFDAVAQRLNKLSLGRGDRIAILHPGGPRFAAILFASASAAVAIPMNPALTEEEYRRLFADLRLDAVLAHAGYGQPARSAAEYQSIPVFDIVWGDESFGAAPSIDGRQLGRSFCPGRAGANDIGFVLATSGTTGRCKIVPIPHRLHLSRVKTRQKYEQISADDRCIMLNPMFLHSGLTTAGVTFLSGSSTIFVERFKVDGFFRCIDSLKPTLFNGSFTFLKSIIDHALTARPALKRGQFRFLRPTSGAVDPRDSALVEDIFGAPVIEMLSSTECGHVAVNPLPPGRRVYGSVGKAADCEIRILGEDGLPLPCGEEGEVLVRGPNVFAGYENDPQANDAAFLDGWYRSGDRGFLSNDGYLTLTGRIKDMINRGGEKISPAEIDNALLEHPHIVDAAAFAIPHKSLGEIVGAAVVPAADSTLDRQGISSFLKSRLSPIKRPNAYLFVAEIPRNALGKIRRSDLAALFRNTAKS